MPVYSESLLSANITIFYRYLSYNSKSINMKYSNMQPIRNLVIFLLVFFGCVRPSVSQTNSLSNLQQYLYPDFSMSVVKLKTGTTVTALMNYNTVTEKMTFLRNGTLMNLDKPETVDTVFMQNKKFVYFEDVFYEVIVDGPVSLFIQHKGILSTAGKPAAYGASSQTASSTSISKLYSDKAYNLKLPDDMKVTPSPVFWVRKDNVMNKVQSERQFLKILPSKEAEIKTFIKQNSVNIKEQNGLTKLVTYCNDLIK
jgi:hypothetical protein